MLVASVVVVLVVIPVVLYFWVSVIDLLVLTLVGRVVKVYYLEMVLVK
jgi:hypothetical protein